MRYKIKTEEDKKIRIADHDIDVFIIENTVYKEKLIGKKEPKGPYLFGYELGAEYTSDEEVHVTVYERPEPYGNIFMGEGGFTSNDLSIYRIERLNHYIFIYDKKGERIHEMCGSDAFIRAIVPKGTKYMENEKGVIISNTIVF